MGRPSCDDQHATEVDRLLPSDGNPSPVRKRRKPGVGAILTISTTAALAVVYAVLSPRVIDKHSMRLRLSKAKKFSSDRQLDKLQHMTDKALESTTDLPKDYRPSHQGHTKLKEVSALLDDGVDDGSSFNCTSQVLIMRHCDKEVNAKVNGKTRKIDRRDIFGQRHCSAKGKRRSEYIATLFVEPEEYDNLKAGSGRGPAAVPMLSSPHAGGISGDADAKPQFPAPLRIYALAAERPNRKNLHLNFREIETITPVASKFGIAVDAEYGVNDEGDLAERFFSDLSDRVAGGVDRVLSARVSGGSASATGTDSPMGSQLCNGGLTLV